MIQSFVNCNLIWNIWIYYVETFKDVVKTLQEQIGTLSIKENAETVDKMTNVLRVMRERLMELQFDSETGTISDYDELNEAHEFLEEMALDPEFEVEIEEDSLKQEKIEL